jgi:hypothetical protein
LNLREYSTTFEEFSAEICKIQKRLIHKLDWGLGVNLIGTKVEKTKRKRWFLEESLAAKQQKKKGHCCGVQTGLGKKPKGEEEAKRSSWLVGWLVAVCCAH